MKDEVKERKLQREQDRALYNGVAKQIEKYQYRLEMARALKNKSAIATQEAYIAKEKQFFKDATGIDYDEFPTKRS